MVKEKKQHHVFIEKEVLSTYKSEWFAGLYACFSDEERLYFLMERVGNGELANFL